MFSGFVALVIGVAGLSVQDFSWLPSRYHSYVVMLIGICGVVAKVFVENARVSRAEDLVYAEFKEHGVSGDEYSDGLNPEYNDGVMSDDRE